MYLHFNFACRRDKSGIQRSSTAATHGTTKSAKIREKVYYFPIEKKNKKKNNATKIEDLKHKC